jgi:uncharacterized protein
MEERNISPVEPIPSQRRYLMSGASGMLGSALREAMSARGATVLQLVRRRPDAPNQFQWDPQTATELPYADVFEGLTAAIHLCGSGLADHRWNKEYKREIFNSRVGSTRMLATALAKLNHPPKMLVVASGVNIYGNRGDEMLDETSRLGKGFLADLCKQWEGSAELAVSAGIRVLHLRFGVVIGSEHGVIGRLLPYFRCGLGAKFGKGRQYMSWISLPDMVGAAMFLLDKEDASGPYNFTAPNPLTNAHFTRLLASQLHRPAFLTIPAFAARLALGEMADETLLASTRAYPARLAAAGYEFQHSSMVHALPALLSPLLR